MQNKHFTHLHVHSELSAFDGLAPISKLTLKAREMGFPALALTDHGNMSGAIKFIQHCQATKDKKGNAIPFPTIKPIIGSELYMSANRHARSKEEQPQGRKGNHHVIVLAQNFEGYQNVCSLSHKSWVEGFYIDPRVDFDLLSKYSKGVICSSACLAGVINANLRTNRYEMARKAAGKFKDIFGENFFLEIMYHGLTLERNIIPDVFKLSKELNIPVIATNDVHYIEKSQAESHELLMCMSTRRCMKDPSRLRFPYPEFYLKSADEMALMFGDAPQVLYNTAAIADRVDFADIKKNLFGGMRLPPFPVPDGFDSPHHFMEHLAWEGMKKLGWMESKAHVAQLKEELADVKVAFDSNSYDFATYFLIVRDYIEYAKKKGILVGCGRGSGPASVLLRCLGITYGPDPLRYGLLWNRFLGFDTRRIVLDKDFGFEEDLTFDLSAQEEEKEEEHVEAEPLEEEFV